MLYACVLTMRSRSTQIIAISLVLCLAGSPPARSLSLSIGSLKDLSLIEFYPVSFSEQALALHFLDERLPSSDSIRHIKHVLLEALKSLRLGDTAHEAGRLTLSGWPPSGWGRGYSRNVAGTLDTV